MTSFVSRDVTHLGVDRIATSPTAFALYENLKAVLEKDSTAVAAGWVLANSYVVEAMLAASAVSQSKLKTAGQTIASTTGNGYVVLSGGQYTLGTTVDQNGVSSTDTAGYLMGGVQWNSGTAANPLHFVAGSPYTGNSQVALIQYHIQSGGAPIVSRYIQASPPYDLGDGEVPLFVFVRLGSGGNVLAVSVAQDPPWANNGPTKVMPHGLNKKGKPVRYEKQIGPADRAALRSAQPAQRASAIARIKAAPLAEVEITQELKQRDMPLIPHSFASLGAGDSVVMVPVGDMLDDLAALHEAGEDADTLIAQGYLAFDATPLPRRAPPGVIPAGVRWKDTP